jgi:hypothetical protein
MKKRIDVIGVLLVTRKEISFKKTQRHIKTNVFMSHYPAAGQNNCIKAANKCFESAG